MFLNLLNTFRKSAILVILAIAALLVNLIPATPASATQSPALLEATSIPSGKSIRNLNTTPAALSAHRPAVHFILSTTPGVHQEPSVGDLRIKSGQLSLENRRVNINEDPILTIELSETLTASDRVAKALTKSLVETCRVTGTLARGAGFRNSLSENVSTWDRTRETFRKSANEPLTSSEVLTKASAKPLAEPSVAIASSLLQRIWFVRGLAGNISAIDSTQKTFLKRTEELLGGSEVLTKASAKALTEFEVKIIDASLPRAGFKRGFADNILAADSSRQGFQRIASEFLRAAESANRSVNKDTREGLNLSDRYVAEYYYRRTIAESWRTAELIAKRPDKKLFESCLGSDTLAKSLAKPFPERPNLGDAMTSRATYIRGFTDFIPLLDTKEKKPGKLLREILLSDESIAKKMKRTIEDEEKAIVFRGIAAKRVTKSLAELSSADGSLGKKYSRNFVEDATSREVLSSLFRTLLAQPLNLKESRAVFLRRPVSDNLGIAVSFNQGAYYVRGLTEMALNIKDGCRTIKLILLSELPLQMADSFTRKSEYRRTAGEALVSAGSSSNSLQKNLSDRWGGNDSEINKRLTKELPGLLLQISSEFDRKSGYARTLTENWQWGDTGETKTKIELSVSLGAADSLSDIVGLNLDNEIPTVDILGKGVGKPLSEDYSCNSIANPPSIPRVWIGNFVIILAFAVLLVVVFGASRRGNQSKED